MVSTRHLPLAGVSFSSISTRPPFAHAASSVETPWHALVSAADEEAVPTTPADPVRPITPPSSGKLCVPARAQSSSSSRRLEIVHEREAERGKGRVGCTHDPCEREQRGHLCAVSHAKNTAKVQHYNAKIWKNGVENAKTKLRKTGGGLKRGGGGGIQTWCAQNKPKNAGRQGLKYAIINNARTKKAKTRKLKNSKKI